MRSFWRFIEPWIARAHPIYGSLHDSPLNAHYLLDFVYPSFWLHYLVFNKSLFFHVENSSEFCEWILQIFDTKLKMNESIIKKKLNWITYRKGLWWNCTCQFGVFLFNWCQVYFVNHFSFLNITNAWLKITWHFNTEFFFKMLQICFQMHIFPI